MSSSGGFSRLMYCMGLMNKMLNLCIFAVYAQLLLECD